MPFAAWCFLFLFVIIADLVPVRFGVYSKHDEYRTVWLTVRGLLPSISGCTQNAENLLCMLASSVYCPLYRAVLKTQSRCFRRDGKVCLLPSISGCTQNPVFASPHKQRAPNAFCGAKLIFLILALFSLSVNTSDTGKTLYLQACGAKRLLKRIPIPPTTPFC